MEFYVDKHRKSLSAARLPSAAPPATAGRPEARLEKRNLNLRPLASLVPYVKRYRWRAIFTLAALILAAVTTLIVPIAARRMIDFGFSARGVALIDPYFLVMIGVAAALAVASALRYYLVNTLGERIVADLRGDVFAHLTSLSPAFFDEAKTGEHRRYDADKGRSGRFRLGRAAQPRLVRGRHRHDGGDQPSAFNLRAGCDSDHRTAALCFRPRRAPPLAVCAGYARGCLGLCRRANRCRPRAASLHQREAWHQPLSRRSRACLYSGALIEPRARRPYCILVAASVVVVLWIGAQDVLGARITPGQLGQFVLYAVFAAGALGSLSEVGSEVAQASGAAERLFELLAIKPAIVRPAHPVKLPSPARGEVAFEDVHFCYPTRMHSPTLYGVSFRVRQSEKVAIVGPSGAGKSTIFHLLLRFYDSNVGRITFDDVPITISTRQNCARAPPWYRKTA